MHPASPRFRPFFLWEASFAPTASVLRSQDRLQQSFGGSVAPSSSLLGEGLSARVKERVVHDATEDARAAGTVEEEMTRRGGRAFRAVFGRKVQREAGVDARKAVEFFASEEVEQ